MSTSVYESDQKDKKKNGSYSYSIWLSYFAQGGLFIKKYIFKPNVAIISLCELVGSSQW